MASCIRVVDEDSGRPYYVSAEFRGDADNGECFDLTVTDLQQAWTAKGVKRPEKSAVLEHWVAVAKDALTGSRNTTLPVVRAEGKPYQWVLTAEGATLKLVWRCRMSLPAKDGTMKTRQYNLHAEAQQTDDARSVIEPLVHQLLLNATEYEVACKAHQALNAAVEAELKQAQDGLDEELSRCERIEEELYVKFAAVLNECKKKTREWKLRAEAAERRLEQDDATDEATDVEENESTDDATDVEDTPAATPAKNSVADVAADTMPLPADTAMADADAEAPADAETSPPPEFKQAPRRKAATRRKAPKRAPKSAPGEMAELDAALTQSQRR